MTWTGQTFSVGQQLTAAQMNNLQADITAVANQDSGAPTVKGSWVDIEKQTISGSPAQVDFTTGIDSTYDFYRLVLIGIAPATDVSALYLRVGTGATPTWQTGAVYNNGATYISISGTVGSATGEGIEGVVGLFSLSSTAIIKHVVSDLVYTNAAANPQRATTAGTASAGFGQYDTYGTAVTALRLYWSTAGNFQNVGTITLQGLRK